WLPRRSARSVHGTRSEPIGCDRCSLRSRGRLVQSSFPLTIKISINSKEGLEGAILVGIQVSCQFILDGQDLGGGALASFRDISQIINRLNSFQVALE